MELLKDFYTLTKLRIVLFDDEFREIISWPGRHSTYCQLIRADSEAKNACNQCDLQACMKCRKSGKLYMYQCHAGLWETVVPLQYESVVIGYLMFGQVLMEGEKSREELWKQVEELPYPVDKAALKAAFFRKKRVSRETFYAAAKIMEACASYLYLSRLIFLQNQDLAGQIETYVREHLQGEIRAEDLCGEYGISRNRLYQVTGHGFGKGIAAYVREIRMKTAMELLNTTEWQISEVAREVGIPDYNYFTKVFKKFTGQTPSQYRKQRGASERQEKENRKG